MAIDIKQAQVVVWFAMMVALSLGVILVPDRYAPKDGEYRVHIKALLLVCMWVGGFALSPSIMASMPHWLLTLVMGERILPAAIAGFLVAYAVAGIAWAVAHFWLYARRLGQLYVMERDNWMRDNNLRSLEALSPEQRKAFDTVVRTVKKAMLYSGEFPLRPLQQKRFFVANLLLWPITLIAYMVGDLALDVARHVWFRLRGWIRQCWEKGMAEYLQDDAACRCLLAEFAAAEATRKERKTVGGSIEYV